MSFRSRLFAIAFGLTATLLQAQEQADTAQDRTTGEQGSTQELPRGFPVRIIEDDEAAKARESREVKADQREKDDLVAQQRMAEVTEATNEATQSMKNAAWFSFGAVAVGTFLLIWTLCLTRKANKAARDAVDVTRDIGERQLRAYVSYSDMMTTGAANRRDIKKRVGYSFAPTFQNFGQTPANNLKITSRHYIVKDGDIPERILEGTSPHPHGYIGCQVGPGSYHSGTPQTFSIEQIIESQKSGCFLVVSARVDYVDIFKVKRFAECCVRIVVVCDED